MDMLHDLARVWLAIAIIGVAILWAATVSRDVKSLEIDMLALESAMFGLRVDVAVLKAGIAMFKTNATEIKPAVLK